MKRTRILSLREYRDLWCKHFKQVMGKSLPESYTDYRDREEAFENYLERFNSTNRIKYFLIAEGPHPDNYIYEDAKGHYIFQPLVASYQKRIEINERLEKLASAGMLLLDLFPFNIDIKESKTRINLISKGIPKMYFSDLNNPYSIYSRLNAYQKTYPEKFDLRLTVNTCFIANPIINHHLSCLAHSHAICENGHPLKPRREMRKGHFKIMGTTHKPELKSKSGHRLPVYFSSASSVGSGYPDSKLIREALLLT